MKMLYVMILLQDIMKINIDNIEDSSLRYPLPAETYPLEYGDSHDFQRKGGVGMYHIEGEAVFNGTSECFGLLGALWGLAALLFYYFY